MVKFFHILLVVIYLVAPTNAFAHSVSNNMQLQMLVDRSDAIFFGEVKEVLYRLSQPSKRSPNGVPHTFVRYQILSTIRGVVNREIILRFVGGADGRGGFMTQSNVPTFRKGERDVLIVSGRTLDYCPLVSCVDGRFRVLENRIFNAWGVPIVNVEKNIEMGGKPRYEVNVIEYPRPEFEDLITRPEVQEKLKKLTQSKTLAQLKKEYEAQAPETIRIGMGSLDRESPQADNPGRNKALSKSDNPPESRSAIPLAELIRALRIGSQKAGLPKNKLVSADPDVPFMAYEWEVAVLSDVIDTPEPMMTPEEEAERESMLEGDDLEN